MDIRNQWLGGASVSIVENETDVSLIWNDGVANEWQETFPTLAHALLRLATLAQCSGSNWTQFFKVGELEFVELADRFFLETVTS
jgi:hypothetical protein